ncbi:MAG TPA: putative DNA-binding domain-containing protein [Rhodanobacteraceae bacterium]
MSVRPDTSPTRTTQSAFAAHLRDPTRAPVPPGIEPRRMAVYAELFFNNVESLLSANFPVIRTLYPDDAWRALVRAFYREHRCHTPLFTEIAREFIRWLEARAEQAAGDPPFLVELAHYEWSELAVTLDEAEIAASPHDPAGDVVDGIPVVSPLARVLAYRFPVHRISADFRPAEAPPQPTLILLARDRSDEVRFLEIDPLTALLFERLGRNTAMSGRACVDALLAELGRDDDTARASGLAILRRLHERSALLGTPIAR